MTNTRIFRPVLVLALVLATAACGGGGGEDAAASGDSASASASQSATVTIADSTFDPGDVTVAAGGSVEWTNDDSLPHTVAFDGDAPEDSDQLEKGDTFSATFDE